MDFADKLLDLAGSIAGGLVPDHLRQQAKARISDLNPFDLIKGNHDLTRAVRLAWIEAALEILSATRSSPFARHPDAVTLRQFIDVADRDLKLVRGAALDRRGKPDVSPIDRHVEAVLLITPAIVIPGANPNDVNQLTEGFNATLAAIVHWPVDELPELPGRIAAAGLPTADGNGNRTFAQLVFDAFAELLKDPNAYPQARTAFFMAMQGIGLDLSREIKADIGKVDVKLDAIMAALDAAGLTKIGTDSGLARKTILELARRLRPDETLNFEQAVAEVANGVNVAIEVIRAGERGTNHDRLVDAVLRRVADKVKAADFDGASLELDDKLASMAEEEERLRRDRVPLLEQAIQVAILKRDPETVARRIGDFASIDQPSGSSVWRDALRTRWEYFYDEGEQRGINLSLEVAIAIGRLALSNCVLSNERGAWYNMLGMAFGRLGNRESGTASLEQSVEAFRAALRAQPRELSPLNWAATQTNLGNALGNLGERENETVRLQEAVEAYQAALEVQTRERFPSYWATTQSNLGNVLTALGKRESGTRRLEQAAAAYRAALAEQTHEGMPLEWAMTQNNLGTVLATLGERESRTERLEEAVVAYRAALKVRTRERVPLSWATTQNNLGSVLTTLGEREQGVKRLEEAIVAYRSSLEEQTRERGPLQWGATQSNLGNALSSLGEREREAERLEEAVTAYRSALEEQTRDRVPLDWAATQNNFGTALNRLGELSGKAVYLEQAVEAYHASLKERTRDRIPLDWATTQNNLGTALFTLARIEKSSKRLAEAISAYSMALEERTRTRVPLDWAMTTANLGMALYVTGVEKKETAQLESAVEAYRAALEVFDVKHTPMHWAKTNRDLAKVLALLDVHND